MKERKQDRKKKKREREDGKNNNGTVCTYLSNSHRMSCENA